MRASIVFGLLTIASLAVSQNLIISTDALCADNTGETCLGSKWGDCCSPHGFCGGNATYCGAGCLPGFGACYVNADLISTDGSCGSNSTTCLGSIFGNCCSATGYCGFVDSYCGDGCQDEFGACGKDATNATVSTTVAASASPSAKGTTATRSSKTSSASTSAASTTSTASASSASSTPLETTIIVNTATSVAEPSQPVTATTGFKAGMIVLAIVLAAVTGASIWFFFFRRRRQPHPQHHDSLQPPTYYEKAGISVSQSELEAAASQSELETKMPQTELSGFPISELPADHRTMR